MEPLRSTEVPLAMAVYREERTRWVDEHGSERLKLAKKLGLLQESDNVYREERRNKEKPGWRLPNEMPLGYRIVPIHNPSIEAMRALEAELETDPEVSLAYVQWKEEFGAEKTSWAGDKKFITRGQEALSTNFIGLPVYRLIAR